MGTLSSGFEIGVALPRSCRQWGRLPGDNCLVPATDVVGTWQAFRPASWSDPSADLALQTAFHCLHFINTTIEL